MEKRPPLPALTFVPSRAAFPDSVCFSSTITPFLYQAIAARRFLRIDVDSAGTLILIALYGAENKQLSYRLLPAEQDSILTSLLLNRKATRLIG